MKASDLFVQALENEGVKYIFGIHAKSYVSAIFLFTSYYPTSTLYASRVPLHRERGHAINIIYAYITSVIYEYVYSMS